MHILTHFDRAESASTGAIRSFQEMEELASGLAEILRIQGCGLRVQDPVVAEGEKPCLSSEGHLILLISRSLKTRQYAFTAQSPVSNFIVSAMTLRSLCIANLGNASEQLFL